MTKTSLFASFLSLSLAACGAVEPTGAYGDGDDTAAGDDGTDMGSAQPDGGGTDMPDPPAPMDAIMLEAPRAATTATAITSVAWMQNGAVFALIQGTGSPLDVSEQRFVTRTDEPIDLRVKFESTPSIDIDRTVVTDIGEQGPSISPDSLHRVWCTSNHDTIDLGDPRCNLTRPVDRAVSSHANGTGATWTVWIYDEASTAKVQCATDATGASCILPGQAGHAYRVVTSVTLVTELWDGTALALLTNQGRDFIGHVITQPYCWDYVRDTATQNFYCNTRYDYTSPVGLDTATMAFSGIRVRVTANGMASTMDAPALSWSYGDTDFPGPTY